MIIFTLIINLSSYPHRFRNLSAVVVKFDEKLTLTKSESRDRNRKKFVSVQKSSVSGQNCYLTSIDDKVAECTRFEVRMNKQTWLSGLGTCDWALTRLFIRITATSRIQDFIRSAMP